MHEFMSYIDGDILLMVIIAAVGIGAWYTLRRSQLTASQQLRQREMEHAQKMKELEIELERAKARPTAEKAA